jgi:hypothetical protein
MPELIELIEAAGYSKIETFNSLDKLANLATWRGFIFQRKVSDEIPK